MMRSAAGAGTDLLPDLCLDAGPAAVAATPDDRQVRAGGGGGHAVAAANKRSSSTPSSKSLSSSVDAEEDRSSSDQQCGWGPVQPRCCQVFRNAKVVLFFLCCLATIQVTSIPNLLPLCARDNTLSLLPGRFIICGQLLTNGLCQHFLAFSSFLPLCVCLSRYLFADVYLSVYLLVTMMRPAKPA